MSATWKREVHRIPSVRNQKDSSHGSGLSLPDTGFSRCNLTPLISFAAIPLFQQITHVRFHKGSSQKSPTSIQSPSTEEKNPPKPVFIYHGAFSSTVRSVKLLSLTTCALSVSLGPIITFITAPGVNVFAKGTIASMMVLFSASTTWGLHWFSSPYIHKLEWVPGSNYITVHTLTWLATFLETKICLSDVAYADTQRPLVTFEADGKYYYIDKDNFPNEKLLQKLLPQEQSDSF